MIEYKEIKLGEYIKDIASGPFGSNLKVECFVPFGFPIIDGANLMGTRVTDNITKYVTEEKARSLARSIAKRHDVIVTISGTLGQISYIPLNSKFSEYLCSQRQFRVTFDESIIDVEYLVYYFHTKQGQKKILSFANYVGVPALAQPLPNFKNIVINIPPIEYQHKVSSLIGAINDKISLNTRMNAELEAMAKQLYDYWFVQFDFPDENGKPYKSSGGKMVYNPALKREIPAGWLDKEMSDIASISAGRDCPSNFSLTKSSVYKIPIYSNGLVNAGLYGYTDKPVSPAYSVTVSARGTIGHPFLRLHSFVPIIRLIVATPFDEGADIYIYEYLKTVQIKNTGSVQPQLPVPEFSMTKIPYPNDSGIIKVFSNLTREWYRTIEKNRIFNEYLTHLRDSLLPMLMNGQVTIV